MESKRKSSKKKSPEKSKSSGKIKRKKSKDKINIQVCCIHCTEGKGKLTKLEKHATWETLQKAALIRNFTIETPLMKENDENVGNEENPLPLLFYHRSCYSIFTMKSTLDRLKAEENAKQDALASRLDAVTSYDESNEIQVGERITRRRTSDNDMKNILPKECIFCEKNKYVKRILERLIPCSELRAIDSIYEKAEQKEDFKMMALVSMDLFAKEAHYHASCYKNYTRKSPSSSNEHNKVDEDENLVNEEFKQNRLTVFKDIVNMLHEKIADNKVVSLSSLQQEMVTKMKAHGYSGWKSNKLVSLYFKRNIVKQFKDIRSIKHNEDTYFYNKTISLDALIRENIDLNEELGDSNIDRFQKCAQTIRADINKMKDLLPWPPRPTDLAPECFRYPGKLERFMDVLLDNRPDTLKLSLMQDIIYNVTRGRVKTPKSVLLPATVKNLTNNTELITILNKFGHGISYSLLMEIHTEEAFRICEEQLNTNVILPESCQKEEFSIYVADNIDRLEETLSGHGTTHKVNNILIQMNAGNFGVDASYRSPKRKRGRRSFKENVIPGKISVNCSKKNRIGPEPLKFPECDIKDFIFGEREKENFLWCFLRYSSTPQQIVPSWTGFNIAMHNGTPVLKSSVHYLNSFDAPATELSTIYQVLERALEIIESMHLVSLVCVFDQAIYSKACEIKWKEKSKFKSCFLMMGVFHILMMFMGILYKRFADAGLQDTLVQSSIVAEGSVEQALKGKSYNRGVRLYKLFYETLIRLIISQMEWDGNEVIQAAKETCKNVQRDDYHNVQERDEFQALLTKFLDFKEELKSSSHGMTKFWLSCIDMIEILLNTIYSVRSGHWTMFVECTREMIPYCFAYNNVNYARYLTNFLGDMLSLDVDFPEIHERFESGDFSVQLSEAKVFSRCESDKVIEMTINKDTKTPGGTTGFSTNDNAVKRWEITAAYRAGIRRCLLEHLNFKKQKYLHNDLAPSRILRDEKDVQSLTNILTSVFIHPFSEMPLTSISTGISLSNDVSDRILNAKAEGTREWEKFTNERLQPDSKISFFDTLKRCNIPPFKAKKRKSCKLKDKVVSIESSKDLFSKIAIIAQSRHIDLSELFCYPLGAVPLALAETDGSLKKTSKANLLHKLERDTPPIEDMPPNSAMIIDGMAVVRQIKTSKLTFEQFATNLLYYVLSIGKECQRVDVVFDVYRDISIKDVERNRRSTGQLTLQKIIPNSAIKQWTMLLSSNHNKNMIVEFLIDQWKNQLNLLNDKELYVTVGDIALHLCSSGFTEVNSLCSDHEEADTRLLLHAQHASHDHNVVIFSPDTDVFIIFMSKSTILDTDSYFMTGAGNKRRIIDINAVANHCFLTMNTTNCEKAMFLDAILGYHCFSGCDSVSAFAGRGKVKPLAIMCKNLNYIETFAKLGCEEEVTNESVKILEKFTCHMYGTVGNEVSIDQLRYAIYCRKNGKIAVDMLPPCFNVLVQHINRANFQSRIWRKSLESHQNVPTPQGYGWIIDDGKLDIQWMTCNPAPDEVLQLISCDCRKCGSNCACITNGFKCTDICKCRNCDNMNFELEENDYEDDTYISDDEDDVFDDFLQ